MREIKIRVGRQRNAGELHNHFTIPAYMKCCDYNVISVDYNPIAREPCYFQAARNTELVGLCTAQLVDELIMNYGFKIEQIHPIGFSLGGQTVGFLANNVKSGRFPRITGKLVKQKGCSI